MPPLPGSDGPSAVTLPRFSKLVLSATSRSLATHASSERAPGSGSTVQVSLPGAYVQNSGVTRSPTWSTARPSEVAPSGRITPEFGDGAVVKLESSLGIAV